MIRRRAAAAVLAFAIPAIAWSAAEFTYDTPQTGYYSIHPMAFAPDGARQSGGWFTRWLGGRLRPDSTTQQCLNAGVNLPDGAIVQDVQVWFTSNGAHELFTTLVRTNLVTGDGTAMTSVAYTDGTNERVTRTKAVDDAVATVDNSKYMYGFGVCIRGRTYFEGARIKYTYQSAGD